MVPARETWRVSFCHVIENGEVITVTYGGCLGACDTGPNALLDGQLYTEINRHEALWLKLQSLIEKKTAS